MEASRFNAPPKYFTVQVKSVKNLPPIALTYLAQLALGPAKTNKIRKTCLTF